MKATIVKKCLQQAVPEKVEVTTISINDTTKPYGGIASVTYLNHGEAFYIQINVKALKKYKLTYKEQKAVLWHEIGHIYYGTYVGNCFDNPWIQEPFADAFAIKKVGKKIMLSTLKKITIDRTTELLDHRIAILEGKEKAVINYASLI